MDTERSLLRVPFECYSRDFRLSQKRVEKEMGRICDAIGALDVSTSTTPATLAQLDEWEAALVGLQREHAQTLKAEERYGQLLAKRLAHLIEGYCGGDGVPPPSFEKARLNRLIIGNLLLNGFVHSARLLAKAEGLTELVDADVFEQLHTIGTALLGHDVEPALEWAATLASRLRRIESPLVLQLRRFQFLELVRTGRKQQALEHASEHFGAAATAADGSESKQSAASNALMQLQQDMALLAFPDPVHCGVPAYERLFEEARWEELRQLLFKEAGRALGFVAEGGVSTLDVVLQAGLVALKLPSCKHTPLKSIDLARPYGPPAKQRISGSACPACNPLLAVVARRLPSCRRTKSRLICGLSHTVMEGFNHPLALPNGSVYGRDALQQMALEHSGTVKDPRTGQALPFKDARRAYMG